MEKNFSEEKRIYGFDTKEYIEGESGRLIEEMSVEELVFNIGDNFSNDDIEKTIRHLEGIVLLKDNTNVDQIVGAIGRNLTPGQFDELVHRLSEIQDMENRRYTGDSEDDSSESSGYTDPTSLISMVRRNYDIGELNDLIESLKELKTKTYKEYKIEEEPDRLDTHVVQKMVDMYYEAEEVENLVDRLTEIQDEKYGSKYSVTKDDKLEFFEEGQIITVEEGLARLQDKIETAVRLEVERQNDNRDHNDEERLSVHEIRKIQDKLTLEIRESIISDDIEHWRIRSDGLVEVDTIGERNDDY